MSDTPMHIYEFGPFRVDALRRLLLCEGNPVRLPAKAFEILLVLLEEKGRLVEKDELMRRVWPDAVVEENNLTVNMSVLRRSLTESPGEHRYVVTVPGRGYQFVADVRQLGGDHTRESEEEALASQRVAEVGAEPGSGQGPQAGSPLGVGSRKIFAACLLLVGVAVAFYRPWVPRESTATDTIGSGAPTVSSIAVLPFQMSGAADGGGEYISDGLSESLINSLSQLPGLKVIARNSTFRYKGKDVDPREVARELGVQALLMGRVEQRTLDPNFALAWAGLARSHRYFSGNSLVHPKEPLAKAKAAALKALELDETLAEAHVEMGGIKLDEWEWAEAEREYKRAIELNPSLVEAHTRYSNYLTFMERHPEAVAEMKSAQELDPLQVDLKLRELQTLVLARRYDEAIELHRSLMLDPNMTLIDLGFLYAAKGMYEQAVKEYRSAPSNDVEAPYMQIALGHSLGMSGKTGAARAILEKLKRTKEYVSPAELAILYIGLGDKEGALASLERAYAAHDLQLQYLKVDPHYDSLRSDTRFQDLVRRVGLPT